MKTALIAALAALSAAALAAPPAYAQRGGDGDRGRHERNNDGRRGGEDNDRNRRGDEARRGDRGQDARRGNQGQRERALQARREAAGRALLESARPRGGGDWAANRGRDGGRDANRGDRGGRGGGDASRGGNRGGGDRDWGDRGRDRGGGDRDWANRDRNRGGGDRDWANRDRNRGGGDRDWGNRDRDRGGRDWASNDRGRDRDWGNRDRNRGGRDWGRDGRRDWRDDDRHRADWDRGRRDHRYRPYYNTHRDFSRPRYSDWRRVRHGYYFDHGYARIVGGFYGRNYYWWSYDGWRRPYRRWAVGYVIPAWLYWEPVPWDLYYRLPPAPYGCRYIYADGDILLVAIATGVILDALLYY